MSRECQTARLLERGGDNVVEINRVQLKLTAQQRQRANEISDEITDLEIRIAELRHEEDELAGVEARCDFNRSEIEGRVVENSEQAELRSAVIQEAVEEHIANGRLSCGMIERLININADPIKLDLAVKAAATATH